MDRQATHLAVLIAAVVQTNGDVIELGMGDYSTPILHELCRNRLLVSYDNDPLWYDKFSYLNGPKHLVRLVSDWSEADLEFGWDVAFVDHAPVERRIVDIRRLVHHAAYVVIHDSEDSGYHYDEIYGLFRYRRDHRLYNPWTTVLSNHGLIPVLRPL